MATIRTRLTAVNEAIAKLIDTGIRRYRTGLSEVEKILLSDLQRERDYLVDLGDTCGLDSDELSCSGTDTRTTNNVSFV